MKHTVPIGILIALASAGCAEHGRVEPELDTTPEQHTSSEHTPAMHPPPSNVDSRMPTMITPAMRDMPTAVVPAGRAGSGTAGSGDLPVGAAGTTVPPSTPVALQDRCLIGSCDQTRLPEQPALEFMEDMGDGWHRLVELDWEIAAGAEGYRCMTFTVPRDVYVVAFAPQVPPGTHHTTFGVSPYPTRPDEITTCPVGDRGERHLSGGAPGAQPTTLPDGVAMPLREGWQIFMNLHLFNLGEQALTGRSGMWIRTTAPGSFEHEAEQVAMGPLQLNIPVGRVTQSGVCTLRADAVLYSAGVHMHQKGVHARVTLQTAQGEVMIHDAPYEFDHQLVYDVGPIQAKAGDEVKIECTYLNDGDHTLHWGDSSLDEMCFAGVSFYPAFGYGDLPCDE